MCGGPATWATLALTLSILCLSAAAAEAPDTCPVCRGIVVSVAGEVTADREGERRSVTVGFVLLEGDAILLKTGARCTILAASGNVLRMDGPSEHRLVGPSEEELENPVAAWISRQIADWAGRLGERMFITRAPLGDWRIEVDVPPQLVPAAGGSARRSGVELVWGTIPGIGTYLVTLTSESGGAVSREVRGHRLEVDDLIEGEQYVWDVEPSVNGWSADRAPRSFRVMTSEDEQLLDLALDGMDDLEAGVLLLAAGRHEEAIPRFDSAARSDENGRSARLWRAAALSEVGLYAEAYEELRVLDVVR